MGLVCSATSDPFCNATGSNASVQVALKACQEGAGSVKDIAFILFSEETYSVWREEAEALGLQPA